VAPVEEKLVQHRLRWFGHIQRRPVEAPVRSGVIRRSGNEKRGRGRPNLICEESVKRDLKDWCITMELALDRREWKLAIHVPNVDLRFLLFYCLLSIFFPAPFRFFLLNVLLSSPFIELVFLSSFVFSPSFSTLFYSCFFGSCGFISSLP
jgi:hypothetical protein